MTKYHNFWFQINNKCDDKSRKVKKRIEILTLEYFDDYDMPFVVIERVDDKDYASNKFKTLEECQDYIAQSHCYQPRILIRAEFIYNQKHKCIVPKKK